MKSVLECGSCQEVFVSFNVPERYRNCCRGCIFKKQQTHAWNVLKLCGFGVRS